VLSECFFADDAALIFCSRVLATRMFDEVAGELECALDKALGLV